MMLAKKRGWLLVEGAILNLVITSFTNRTSGVLRDRVKKDVDVEGFILCVRGPESSHGGLRQISGYSKLPWSILFFGRHTMTQYWLL